jgi:NodT family efflux transporter outer membrane factor (OMF) lipoprotein
MRNLLLLTSCLTLSGCFSTTMFSTSQVDTPLEWSVQAQQETPRVDADTLHGWWRDFADPSLNDLVDIALKHSPDRQIAEARIAEARGLRRSARSLLLPQISGSVFARREDADLSGTGQHPDNFYDAGFDASYEVDVFGKNRNNFKASDDSLNAIIAQYNDVTITLIAEVARSYIDYRAAQNHMRIAEKNLQSQEKTLALISDLHELGAAPRLDVERATTLVNNTKASTPEYRRVEENARLRLSTLTGVMPVNLMLKIAPEGSILEADAQPVLLSPVNIISLRPDIRAAAFNLSSASKLTKAAIADFFPQFNISAFYGVSETALSGGVNIWRIAAGAAVSLLDFGRIEGRIDAASAREQQAFAAYRKAVIGAVVEVETALNDYANITAKQAALGKSYQSASKALDLSQDLYKEGEISFLDVLDAQRSANNAEAALITAQALQVESLVRLYKSLGVY